MDAQKVTLRKMAPSEYDVATLAAAEELVAREGKTSLNLNVVGDNEKAIAMYRRNGHGVSSMYLSKSVQR
ncbi:hypothetical protein [Streptomyces sp. NEAU-174]|uniref:hypothetical protein n=1 Tax=Streptomyces sp. NEAU-174 TaxID=3458254 RepID=UPI004043F85E